MDIAVIGAGSYGTCLAKLLSDRGHTVTLWCHEERTAKEIAETRENSRYMPGRKLSASVTPTADIAEAVSGRPIVVGVTPSQFAREVLGKAASHLDDDAIVVNAAKGLELRTHMRLDQVYRDIFPEHIARRAAYLSGPTFAVEVAAGQPSAIVVAGRDPETTRVVQEEFSTDRFRVYSSEDVIGVLVGGALKNVVAICAGLSDGLGFGQNARAALITRGLAEISRIGVAMGANPLTFAGLSGLGDLVLTCAGDLSRNRQVGLKLGAGKKLDAIVGEMHMVAEGVKTTEAAYELAAKLEVDAPLTSFMYRVLYENLDPRESLGELMTRPLKPELD